MTDQPKVATKTTVAVYTRHRMSCSAKHRGEFTRSCDCPKWLRYSRNGSLHRQSAGTRTWSLAEDKAVELQEALDRGDTPRPIVVKAPQATIADAIGTFISAKESEGISTRRVQKLKVLLDEFDEFMRGKNKLYPSLLTATDVIDYRATWDKKWKATTRQKAQQNLRGFLRTCCRENLNDLLAALRTIRLSKEDKHRLEPKPFAEDEIKTLFNQIPKSLEPEDVEKGTLLVKYMIASGVAIRDAVQLERSWIKDCWLRFNRQKTGRTVRQHLDPALCKELLSGKGKYVFWEPDKMTIGGAVTKWQDDIRLVMQDANLWIKGNTTHRFRDTAVDFWLGQGCSLTDIAAMLGDTLAVCERHYASLASARMEARLATMPRRSWTEGAHA